MQQRGSVVLDPLGPWEPTIEGMVPYEDLVKYVCDFLWMEVVKNNDPQIGWEDNSPIVLEIEAKVGQLWDREQRFSTGISCSRGAAVSQSAAVEWLLWNATGHYSHILRYVRRARRDRQSRG